MTADPIESSLRVFHFGQVSLLRLPPNWTKEWESVLIDHLTPLVSAQPERVWVLNCAEAELTSSSALGKLICIYRTVRAGGGRVVLCCMSEYMQDMLKRMKLDLLFEMMGSEQQALERCNRDAEVPEEFINGVGVE